MSRSEPKALNSFVKTEYSCQSYQQSDSSWSITFFSTYHLTFSRKVYVHELAVLIEPHKPLQL